jgi:soluble lytic murein transglycosylase-like protein
MADDDRYLTGGGELIPEQRSASYSTNTSLGPFSGSALLSGQDEAVPVYGGRFTAQLPEGLSTTLSRTNQAGETGAHARDAIQLAKQIGAGQLALEASRVGSEGLPSYGLQYSQQIGREGGAPSYYPQPKGGLFIEAGGTPHTPERHVRGGARFNFADGGHIEAALHAIRHHLAGGGFLSDLFSGPDYLSTGEVASPANWGDPESAADFFRADKARMAAERAPDVGAPFPPRRPVAEAEPRPQIAAAAPAPTQIPFDAPKTGMAMPETPQMVSFASQPLAYTAVPAPAPASAAIDAATGKLTNRVDPNSDAERAENVWSRMLRQESGNRQFDRNGRTITSPAGALGISQVMPSTGPEAARLAGMPWSLERLRNDPEYNHALGRAYYDAQVERFGGPTLAAAAYNGGPGRVAGALRQAQATGRPWTDFLKPETQNYVRVVGRAHGGLVDDALHVVREHHADGEAVGEAPETNSLGMTPDQFAEYIQTKAPLAPGFVENALRNVREYAMPRGEDYTHAMDQSAAAADYLTKSGKEGMLSGNPWEMAKGAGKSMLGTALPVIAPVGAAFEAGIINPAERVLGPAGRHAAEVATMVPGEGVGAALKSVAKYAPEISPVAAAMSMIPKAASTAAPARELSPLGFYSHGAETAAGLQQAKGTPEQYAAMLQQAGVKPVEMEGFRDMFAGRPSVTREEIAQHFQQRMPQVEERVLGQKMTPEEIARLEELDKKFSQQGGFTPEEKIEYNALYQKEGALANSQTKFSQYTLPGGENYREVLLKMPEGFGAPQQALDDLAAARQRFKDVEKRYTDELEASLTGEMSMSYEDFDKLAREHDIAQSRVKNFEKLANQPAFQSGHWQDPNVLAHLRMADRTGPNGEKILHVEEIQSDWGQKGKKEGFQPANVEKLEARRREIEGYGRDATPEQKQEWANIMNQLRPNTRDVEGAGAYKGVPTAPYVTNTQAWTDLALKRALKEAAEGGYDKLVWTPGAEQAKRYDLSKQISNLEYVPSNNHLKAYDTSGRQVIDQMGVPPEKISDYVGKDVAAKLLNDENAVKFNGETGFHRLSGLDLQTGGEGMKGYYDKIVPNQLSKLVKKLDPEAKIGRETLETRAMTPEQLMNERTIPDQNQVDFHSLTITPKMRESILKGQTAFKDGGSVVDRALMLISKQA